MPQTLPIPWRGSLELQGHYWITAWRIERTDGVVLRLTTHDRTIGVWIGGAGGGVQQFVPGDGYQATARQRKYGLQEQNTTARGVLSSSQITHEDLREYRYDGAQIDEYLVDWRDPYAGPVMQHRYWISTVSHGPSGWTAEVEGVHRWLKERVGVDATRTCVHALGDANCGVVFSSSLRRSGMVVDAVFASKRYQFSLTSASFTFPPADGFYDFGYVEFTTGNNAGIAVPVKQYLKGTRYFSLDSPAPADIESGDQCTITVGCDKTFSTCKSKFANGANFLGFPFLPGDDALKQALSRKV